MDQQTKSGFGVGSAAVVVASILSGCGIHRPPENSASTETEVQPAESSDQLALVGVTWDKAERPKHHVGDVEVHRFSGTFTKQDLVLREEVVKKDDATFTVLYTLDEGASETRLLVTRAARSERIVAVKRLTGQQSFPASTADYEAMMAKTLFVPDFNDGEVSKKSQTCLVDDEEHDCEIAEYRVFVADQEAKMSVARSRQLDRDVMGEVVGVDGTLIYHAELLEVESPAAVAHDEELAIVVPIDQRR